MKQRNRLYNAVGILKWMHILMRAKLVLINTLIIFQIPNKMCYELFLA